MIEDECLPCGLMLLLMKETNLVNSSEYRLTASLLTLSNTNGDPSCWVQGCCSRLGDNTAVVEVVLRVGVLARDEVVLGVREEAGLEVLGVAGLVTTFLKSSWLMPRISDTFATIVGSHW